MKMLWHPALIPLMPDSTLKKLSDYCCYMRENWRVKNGPGNIPPCVWYGSYEQLLAYQVLVFDEMERRGLEWVSMWDDLTYRGSTDPFRALRDEWLSMYLSSGNPYEGFHTKDRLILQVSWLEKRGKNVSKIRKALEQKGFKTF